MKAIFYGFIKLERIGEVERTLKGLVNSLERKALAPLNP
jgi:hypothetical protein